MGNCFSKYDSIQTRTIKIITRPDGTTEKVTSTTTKRNQVSELEVEEL